MKKIEELLESIGLEKNESKIYLESLKLGTSPASILGKKIKIPRTTAYYACEQLVKKQLMIESKKGNSKFFTAEHPNKIKVLIQVKKNELNEKEDKIDSVMHDLIKMQNPFFSLPKVTYYEGIEGIKKVLWDSLNAKEVVENYTDVESVIKYIPELNKEYSEERRKLGVKKRSIYSDSETAKQYIKNIYKNEKDEKDELNNMKFLDLKKYNLNISFMIYDGKITYITIKENNFLGVIIENQDIYHFHKNIFSFMWNNLDSKNKS